jgi:lipopolysaccharide/colanic/teichoic acid biosynthesis glycosyltransferase
MAAPATVEGLHARARIPEYDERPLRFRASERALDLLIGVPLFVVTLPLQLLLALWIKFDSPGPALFRQQRLTLNARCFIFLQVPDDVCRRANSLFSLV